jgi:hypothetical protein
VDDVHGFLGEFAQSWRDSRLTRLMCYALVGALIITLLAGALAEISRPRIYVVTGEVPGDGR